MIDIEAFIRRSLDLQPEVAARFAALKEVETRRLRLPRSGTVWIVQFNPARAISTKANLTDKALKERPCFLCRSNRSPRQPFIEWEDMEILVNPFPIFPGHLTICARSHVPQTLEGRIAQMRRLSRELEGYTVFFNGARCGATAPDHMHFQAVPSQYIRLQPPAWTYRLDQDHGAEEAEQLINAYCTDGTVTVMPRRKHRPECYPSPAISPGAVDIAGTLIAVDRHDFETLTPAVAEEIITETSYQEPTLYVAIEGDTPTATRRDDSTWAVEGVKIGKDFHWERRQSLVYGGEMLRYGGRLINRIPLEEYLKSVISSEMNARADLELLKAHAVISRSWAVAQLRWGRQLVDPGQEVRIPGADDDICTWQDRDDHCGYDLCSDDHCQRYQGVTRQSTPLVSEAVEATRGLVLTTDEGRLVDARFSKCCGGMTEEFYTCWQPRRYNSLRSVADPYCNCSDREVLGRVLNDYDLAPDFYRWRERLSPSRLRELIKARSGIDFGDIVALTPLSHGASGRIYRLRITGTLHTAVIGKELTIRRWLSDSHLRSSAFDISREADGTWVFKGRGWGHGVGLCQIGAAVMAYRGFDFKRILAHYYPGTHLTRL